MRLVLLALAILVSGCAPQTLQSRSMQSYQVGQTLQASPGSPLLTVETGTLRTVRRWVGILNSPDGWETTTAADSSWVKTELLYSGMSGNTIELAYREFRGGLAAPAFFQSAKYDLAQSREITFQRFRIRVDSADNNHIRAVLLSDGTATASASTAPSVSPKAASGRDAVQAEQLARSNSCSTQPKASLTASGAGFETYNVPCANGDALAIRCEFGNCRVLR